MEDYITATTDAIGEANKHNELKSIPKINTPFGYFGSKNKIALQLCRNLPPHMCWVEAFCGSAALTLSKRQAPIEVINDIDGDVVNVFKQLRNNHAQLCRLLSLTPYAKLELENARLAGNSISDLERARNFLIQAMFAVNGVFGKEKGGFSYSQSYSRNGRDARVNRWYNLPDRILPVVERLRNVRIENRNAIEILEMFKNRPATLMYIDPPYLGERTEGYSMDANDHSFHMELIKLAKKSKCMIFISGYESDLYSSELNKKSGWNKRTINTITKDVNGNEHKRIEVVWTNSIYQKAAKSKKLPLRLTKEELRQKKLNPERGR